MNYKSISVWWDEEGDFLSVTLAEGEGDMVPTKDGRATVKIDDEGNILGFHILGVTKTTNQKPFRFDLVPAELAESVEE
ncbi:MAG: DUF2283 domain-containing protein [Chloroflexi bacterium]|nr:DUF2283 domain-containing protein [Chloroflexota bacterium]